MCGVLLYINHKDGVDLDKFHTALSLQNHRGPDDFGVYVAKRPESALEDARKYSSSRPFLAVGHKRLSIIDLSTQSRQPVVNHKKRTFMSYNGEIYNFMDFASNSTSQSDTLTLFELLNTNYVNCLDSLNGMWGIIFGDLNKGEITFCRDRYGKKPLYYHCSDTSIIISSEIKSIYYILNKDRVVNPRLLSRYLIAKLTPYPNNIETFYHGIKSVMPGEVLTYKIGTKSIINRASVTFKNYLEDLSDVSKNNLIEKIKNDLEYSVSLRLRSDVKVGVLISGGVDSSAIAGYAANSNYHNVEFYTCHLVDNNNQVTKDLEFSRRLASDLGIKLNEIEISDQSYDFNNILRHLTKYSELPTNFLLSTVPTYLISKAMKENGVGVAIDGIGGDEIFGGYPSFQSLALAASSNSKLSLVLRYAGMWSKLNGFNAKSLVKFYTKIILSFITKNTFDGFDQINENLKALVKTNLHEYLDEGLQMIRERNTSYDVTERQEFEIQKYQLPFYLGTGDTFNMMNSIENRSPLLDVNLKKYTYISDKLNFDGGFSKSMLRQAMHQNIPDYIRWRSDKTGITSTFNLDKLLNKENLELIIDSNFIKEISQFSLSKEYLLKNKFIARSLLSLAVLDDVYKLKLN